MFVREFSVGEEFISQAKHDPIDKEIILSLSFFVRLLLLFWLMMKCLKSKCDKGVSNVDQTKFIIANKCQK